MRQALMLSLMPHETEERVNMEYWQIFYMEYWTEEFRKRWEAGVFHEKKEPKTFHPRDLPWIPYEDYMRAQIIGVSCFEHTLLRVEFPSEQIKGSKLHIHPLSNRMVEVLDGSGTFVAIRNGNEISIPLEPGDVIWMPRGIVHTFHSGPSRLIVESAHVPFIPLDDPMCLIYL
jgi:hypothetical protein